jgi:hypothetical protein
MISHSTSKTGRHRRQDALCQNVVKNDMHQGFQKVTADLAGPLKSLAGQMQEVQYGLSTSQARFDGATSYLLERAAGTEKSLVNANRNAREQHNKTRQQMLEGNTKVIDTISSKLQNMHKDLTQTRLSATKSGREVRFYGHSRGAVLFPLLLLQSGMSSAIFDLLSRQSDLISAQDLYFLKAEFENILSSATQEAAAISRRSTASSFDNWTSSAKIGPRDECVSNTEIKNPEGIRSEKRPRMKSWASHFTFPVGQVDILIRRPNSLHAYDYCDNTEVGFSFIPRSDICSTSVQGNFMRVSNLGPEPRLYAQLNAFKVIKDRSVYFELFRCGTLEEIDIAFREGKVTPYDQDTVTQILCHHHVRTRLLQGDSSLILRCPVCSNVPSTGFIHIFR